MFFVIAHVLLVLAGNNEPVRVIPVIPAWLGNTDTGYLGDQDCNRQCFFCFSLMCSLVCHINVAITLAAFYLWLSFYSSSHLPKVTNVFTLWIYVAIFAFIILSNTHGLSLKGKFCMKLLLILYKNYNTYYIILSYLLNY